MEVLEEAQEPVSLILLDIIMPVMDGFQFLKWIQSAEAYRNIPIILSPLKPMRKIFWAVLKWACGMS